METAEIPVEETWNLEELFADENGFEAARQRLEADITALDRWRNRLGDSASTLAEALDGILDAYKRLARLRCYAGLRADEDTRIAVNRARRQSVELLATTLTGKVAWLRPEILALDPRTVEAFLADEPRLKDHAFFLRDLLRQREHVLSPAEERILAESGLVTGSASSLYHVLHNVDLPRPEVQLPSGKTVKLTPVNFHRHRTTTDRADRLAMFPPYFSAYSAFRDTLGQNLYASLKSHMFRARVRGYDSCLAAALDADNVPAGVYRNLIAQVRERLPLLHRYLELRRRALGLETLEYADMYCPLTPSSPRRYATTEARRAVEASLAPLGAEYVRDLARAFDQRWIDWHARPGKRSGAYASGWAYDVHPYVLINFTGDYDSVSTLTHEMGHAMHSFYSNRTQPYATADYSIFVAEVASTLNETLLADWMLDNARERDEQLYLLASRIDTIRGTLFRQTMFAEFELEIHERAERGEVLTGDRLDEIYLRLLREYHGHDAGVMRIDEPYAAEWGAVPHFYYDFYVYQYSTGIVAAMALAAALSEGRGEAVERYLTFLGRGGSDYPLELLRAAGVDLETAAPYDDALASLERQLDRLESLLDPQN